jgi:hypothetical protein
MATDNAVHCAYDDQGAVTSRCSRTTSVAVISCASRSASASTSGELEPPAMILRLAARRSARRYRKGR